MKSMHRHPIDSIRSRAGVLTFIFFMSALLTLGVTPAGAEKTHVFLETFGSAAKPALKGANALAVDQSSGDLLMIDTTDDTVSRYHADGTSSNFSALGTNVIDAKGLGDGTPQNGFQFSIQAGEQQVAIDNSGTVTDGNIYVTQGLQAAGNLVDVFAASGEYLGQLTADKGGVPFGTTGSFPFSPCGVAVDDGGNVYLAGGYDKKIYKFDPTTNVPVNADNVATFPTDKRVCSIAAGAGPSAGSLFVNTFATFEEESVLKLDSGSGVLKGIVDPGEARLVSSDPESGHAYVLGVALDSNNSFVNPRVNEYAVSGTNTTLTSSFPASNVKGIAIYGTSGRIYLSGDLVGGPIHVYSPLVTIPEPTTGAATITGNTSVTLNGKVDPDGVALEECRFEYGTTTAYGQSVPCAETPAEIGTTEKAVHAEVTGLVPETLYHFRLIARNANATIPGEDESFKTPSKPALDGPWSADVAFSEATLKARVDPENSPTTYRFEWGLNESYGQSTGEISVGTAAGFKAVSLPLSGLIPGATYHYRLVATNGIGITASINRTFTTYPLASAPKADCPNQAFRAGPSAFLPDCRAYEMVSPVEKGNADIAVRINGPSLPAGFDQSSVEGNRFSFSSEKAFGDAVSAPYTSQYLATRIDQVGWSTEAVSPARGRPVRELGEGGNNNASVDTDYKIFSPDLTSGWFIHNYDPTLDECAPSGFANLYRRDETSGYEALTTAAPSNQTPPLYWPVLQGLSGDGTVAVFAANAKLTANASSVKDGSEPIYQLYEHVSDPSGEDCGELRLISVLPNGNASNFNSSAGTPQTMRETRESTLVNAVSGDGNRVFWSTNFPDNDPSGPATLYLHIVNQKTVLVAAGPARYWSFAADGSRAIYEAAGELFEYDAEAGKSASIAKGAKGVAGASEDLSRLYFVSTEALGGEGEAGEPNLYLRTGNGAGATIKLVATLAAADVNGSFTQTPLSVVAPEPIKRSTRISTDGSTLAFLSAAPLTGYDNKDARDGVANMELYRYDAVGDNLLCVSCNPSGARPRGREITGAQSMTRRVAALLPAWETQDFAPRALSEDGERLFFESFEALLPTDTNGAADVYGWQSASGADECAQRGAGLYVAASGGCLSLISTGRNPNDSRLIDASPDGSDVFFKTASSLVPQDPGLIDIYDARIGGGLPAPPSPPGACEGEACQGPPTPPDDPTPASAAFEGAGNLSEGPSGPRCTKPKVRRRGRCVEPKPRHAKRTAPRNHTNGRAGR